jgi:class 3 adenylate cyclase
MVLWVGGWLAVLVWLCDSWRVSGEPEVGPVEFAHTSDGVSIGLQRFGRGRLVVELPAMLSSLRVMTEVPAIGDGIAHALSSQVCVVRYDRRGTGWSDRSVVDAGLEASLLDLEAVIGHIGRGPVPLLAPWGAGPVALHMAVAKPELVSHLVFWATSAGPEYFDLPLARGMAAMCREDWELFVLCMTRVGWFLEGGDARRCARLMHSELSHEAVTAQFDAGAETDASDLLGGIEVPTLAIEHPWQGSYEPIAKASRQIATGVAGARLLKAEDPVEIADAVLEFIGGTGAAMADGGFRTIMFTDLVSSTALTQQLGDESAQEVLRTHDRAVRGALSSNGGREVKHTGDGIMAAFSSATDAVSAAIEVAQVLAEAEIAVRVGLNAGEPIEQDGDFFGTAVQLAARVCDNAQPGEVVVTAAIRDLTAGKGFRWLDERSFHPKGFDTPVTTFALDHSQDPH